MKNDILDIFKEGLLIRTSLIFISLFPVTLLLSTAILNAIIVIMNVLFLIHVFSEKKFSIFNNDLFYFLFALWAFFIINTLLNANFQENYSRGFGFVRFILFIFLFLYFFSYKNFLFKKIILNIWTIIFIIVSLDLIFEFFVGFNTLGFKANYPGRLAGFMGADELKIGHWYLCFSLIILSNNFNQHKKFWFFLFFSIFVCFLIGERANFIRLFFALLLLTIITNRISFKGLSITIFIIGSIFFTVQILEKNEQKASNEVAETWNNKFEINDRYFSIINFFKADSIREMHNNNKYTPMYFGAYNVFKENKFLGAGLGSYYKKSGEMFRKYEKFNEYKILPNTHPHQYSLEILATLGLPGFLFIFLFLFYFIYKSFSFYSPIKKIINLSSFLMIIVFFIPLLPTGSFFTTYGATIFWLNFSLMNLGNIKNINY